jgi:GTP-binding protein
MIEDNMPKVAIIGRPNVGKSTLINRICKNTEAIVHKEPMITRDRKYYTTDWNGKYFQLLDTGGIDMKSKQRLTMQILLQTKKAIGESDLIIFLVDLKEPLSPMDEEIIKIVRKTDKKIILVGNKHDNTEGQYFTEDFLKLGFGYPLKISAVHGINIGDLLDEIVKGISDIGTQTIAQEDKKTIPSIAILGQPNVGKSTLFNSIIREERTIVDEVAGTTRDSIDSVVSVNNKKYKFIDTAGLKKNKLHEENLEYYSKLRTVRTIEKSDVGLILFDCTKPITKQDLKIVETCIEKRVSTCIVFNKTDIVGADVMEKLVEDFGRKLKFVKFVPFLKISALKGKGLKSIFKMIDLLMEERGKKISDSKLTNLFKELEGQSILYWKGKKFRIKFMRQTKTSPPIFLVFSNMDIRKKTSIKRFIENTIRDNFGFMGTPMSFRFKY